MSIGRYKAIGSFAFRFRSYLPPYLRKSGDRGRYKKRRFSRPFRQSDAMTQGEMFETAQGQP